MTTATSPTDLTFIATCDLSAVTKGRALAVQEIHEGDTVGWVPANLGIGASGSIVDQIPFGSTGDLRLLPDLESACTVVGVPGQPYLQVVMGDVVTTDGQPWGSCARTFLKQAVADLESELGITVQAAFEHEFVDLDADGEHHPFSWRNYRAAEPMGSQLVGAMRASGLHPENWLAEYGRHQYEITVERARPVAAADRAVLLRDLVRDIFGAHEHRATFTPVVKPGETGSGVHVHIGFTSPDGSNPMFDESRPGRLSEMGGRFAAGVLAHSRALSAFFAPLTISYLRLRPHQWSSAGIFLGLHNRESLLRVCPTVEIGGRDPEPQLHLEFRGADAGANPYLVLGTLLRAGLEGIRQGLEPAPLLEGEIEADDPALGLPSLPQTLSEALDVLESSPEVTGWFDPDLVSTFVRIKRVEIEQLSELSLIEQCQWYARVY